MFEKRKLVSCMINGFFFSVSFRHVSPSLEVFLMNILMNVL